MVSDMEIQGDKLVPTGGLNPCLSGRWSLTYQQKLYHNNITGLNPCLSGRWSLTPKQPAKAATAHKVLILV